MDYDDDQDNDFGMNDDDLLYREMNPADPWYMGPKEGEEESSKPKPVNRATLFTPKHTKAMQSRPVSKQADAPKGNGRRGLWIGIAIAILIALAGAIYWAVSLRNTAEEIDSDDSMQPLEPEPMLVIPSTPSTREPYTPEVVVESDVAQEPTPVPQPAKLSPYDQGYADGCDDAEDDAVNGYDYGSGYNPSNSFKGKERQQYIRGYREGYYETYEEWIDEYDRDI